MKEKHTILRRMRAKQITFCAMAIALGTVLSNIKLIHFPTGGAVTLLSMLVICLPGYFFGLGVGIVTGVAYGVLQLLMDPYILSPIQVIIDYFLAYNASYIFAEAAFTVIIISLPPVKSAMERIKQMALCL